MTRDSLPRFTARDTPHERALRRLTVAACAAVLVLVAGCKGDPAPPPVASPTAPNAPPTPVADVTRPAPDPDGWQTITPPGAGVRFELPGEPDHRESKVSSASGVETSLHQYLRYEEQRNRTFIVAFSPHVIDDGEDADHADHDHAGHEHPPAPTPKAPPEHRVGEALDAIIAPQISAPGRKLVSRNVLGLGGHPGREVIIDSSEGRFTGRIHFRVFLIGEQMFQLIAAVPGEADYPDAERFLTSFSLTSDAPAPVVATATASWKRLAGDGFSTRIPAPAERVAGDNHTPFGLRRVTTYATTGEAPRARYTVNAIALDDDQAATPPAELVQTWRLARTESVVASGLTFQQTISVKAAGGPGRQLIFQTPAATDAPPRTLRYLGVPRDGVFYELIYEPLDASAGAAEASRFFDGLRFGPTPSPAPKAAP